MESLFRTAWGVFFLLGALLPTAAAFQAPDPFLPGLRWERASNPLDPWIPGPVSFGGEGETAMLLAAQGNRHAEVLSAAAEGAQAPAWRLDQLQGTQGALGIAGADRLGRFVCLSQLPYPGSTQRTTRVELFDPRLALLQQPAQAWSHDAALIANGPARIALDAARSVCALAICDPVSARVDLDLLRLSDGQLLSRRSWSATHLQDLALSADGSTLAMTQGGTLVVLDLFTGIQWQESIPLTAQAVALSADGSRVALGGPNARMYQRTGSAYSLAWFRAQGAQELCTRLALSADGERVALGWWHSVQTGVRLEFIELTSQSVLWSRHQPHPGGNLQNYVESVALTASGARAAFALWGDGSADPEFLLVDAQQGVLLARDLPGSARGLALDAEGRRALLAMKDVHANMPGSAGRVQLFDTAERALVQRSRAEIGQVLALAARRPASSTVFFLQGPPSPQPMVFPGTVGALLLVRSQLTVHARPADAQGRADLGLRLPLDPLLIGSERFFQAAFRRNGQLEFDSVLERVLIL